MNTFTIQSYPYNEAPISVRKEIAEFLNGIWPDDSYSACGEIPASHRAELSAQSFCCYSDNTLAGYAGAVQKEIFHCGHNFRIAGLSCVATRPDYRGRGIGRMIVAAATHYMITHTDIDFGIFTCHPDLATFYERAGGWNIRTDMTLIGSHDFEALSSKSLHVVVLLRLFSAKAQSNTDLLCSEPVSLDFPIGEFL